MERIIGKMELILSEGDDPLNRVPKWASSWAATIDSNLLK